MPERLGLPRFAEEFCRRTVLRALSRIERGSVTVLEGGRVHRFGTGEDGPSVEVRIESPEVFGAVALNGTMGAGEAYIRGLWKADDLTGLLRLFVLNRASMRALDGAFSAILRPVHALRHFLRRNSKSGSRRNIAAHYDLGNEFFRLFLDPRMMYSAAVFERAGMSLAEASEAKLDLICRKLELGPGDHLLEIGTGWGGLAVYAAERYGCRVTTATISRRQAEHARAAVAEAGLSRRVDVVLKDYRELRGSYDKLVSIEMVEAVGAAYLGEYFQACSRLLVPEGMMLLQGIVIGERDYERALRRVDFIQKYIFPGSFIPSIGALSRAVGGATDFNLFHCEDFGPHYARTLHAWRGAFTARLADVRAQGFDEAFIRMWEFYLAYCEAAFEERHIGVVQMLLTKPGCRRAPLMEGVASRRADAAIGGA